MKIIISPAKKMNVDTDSLPWTALPQFLPEAELLTQTLQKLDDNALQALWGCNDSLAALNIERLRHMNLQKNLTPALLCYEGIQYQHMAPGVFTNTQFAYIDAHLRILSGFYGLLRPFDGVTPYRLEMQARLAVGTTKDLYGFWGDKPAKQLAEEDDFILNLASKEYSKVVSAFLPKEVRFLTCTFGELQEGSSGKVIEKGTMCKMARGAIVRWLAEHDVHTAEDIKAFDSLGYGYHEGYSTEQHFVFIKAVPAQKLL